MFWWSICYKICNASGVYETGEDNNHETHLITLILQVLLEKTYKNYMFGDDYQTEDATCLRNYIHVINLASDHYKPLEYIRKS